MTEEQDAGHLLDDDELWVDEPSDEPEEDWGEDEWDEFASSVGAGLP